jgi:transketolase
MAISGKWLQARCNRPNFDLFNYNVYVFCSDGDLMEGVGSEAASLAGHLKLSNLCWIYDANQITLDGPADWSFSEDVAARFGAYGWNVVHAPDANDLDGLAKALHAFLATNERPTLVIVNSHIGYGSPHKQDTNAAHGEPLGEEEVKLAKRFYGWPEDAHFLVPEAVLDHFQDGIGRRGHDLSSKWNDLFAKYGQQFPDLHDHINRMQRRELPDGWDKSLPDFPADPKGLATRESSGKVLNAIAQNVPWMIGGSADLATSNKTTLKFDGAGGDFKPGNYGGRNLHFGVREHAMGAALTGMAMSKLRAFGATFFNFTDYMRPSMRLAAITEIPTVYVLTHDSIGLGEDGPTHQPVEQLASLRAMPHMMVMRPGDSNEVVEAWKAIMPLKHSPVSLVLTRQALPTLDRTKYAPASGVAKGAYVLADSQGKPDLILIGTGSELSICVAAYEKLAAEGLRVRVVSMPSWELFEQQSQSYRDSVLPPDVRARVSVEAGSVFGWERYVGLDGAMVGMTTFGASAPAKDLFKKFGFTVEHVLEIARGVLAKKK